MGRMKGGSIPPPKVVVRPGEGGVITTLNDNDVLSGRGGRINNHSGNITFRIIVEDYKREYLDPRTRKLEKAHVAARLVAQIRNANPPGRFLKEDPDNPGMFSEIGDLKAWKKTGQALREDAPDIRKDIPDDDDEDENFTPQPLYHHPTMPAGIPPSVSYSPNSLHTRPLTLHTGGYRPDPPEAEGVTGYRQPPLPYFESNHAPRPRSFLIPGTVPQSPHFPAQLQNPPPIHGFGHRVHPINNYVSPPNHYQHPRSPHPNQSPPFSTYPNGPNHTHANWESSYHNRTMYPIPQPQPQHSIPQSMGANHRHASQANPLLVNLDRRKDFPSLAMSTATDFTMSDVSEFTPLNFRPPPVQDSKPVVWEGNQTDPLKAKNDIRESDGGKARNSLALSELTASGLNIDPGRSMDFSFSALGRTQSFPDLLLSSSELPLPTNESDKDRTVIKSINEESDSIPITATKPLSSKIGCDVSQAKTHRPSSSGSDSFSMDSLKLTRGFHPVRGRTSTEVSALLDAMSLMSMDTKSVRSDTSWLEAAKSIQSVASDMNPWDSSEGSIRHLHRADDGSIRSLSDMSNDMNPLDLVDYPLLPPMQHTESGFEDNAGFINALDP